MNQKYENVYVENLKHLVDINGNMWNNIYHFWRHMLYTERVSSIEWYWLCPKKYDEVKFDGTKTSTIIATYVGTIVHLAHQYPDLAEKMAKIFCNTTLVELTWARDNILLEQINNMIAEARKWIEEYKDRIKYFEIGNNMVIEWVLVTWTYDVLVIEWDEYHLQDFKTAGNINYYSDWSEKIQPLIYSYFVMKKFWLDSIKFSYCIYVKWKWTSKVTVYRKTKQMYIWKNNGVMQAEYIDNIEHKVHKIINEFRLSKESWFFIPKKSSSCYYCPLRQECNLWQWDASLDNNTELEINF